MKKVESDLDYYISGVSKKEIEDARKGYEKHFSMIKHYMEKENKSENEVERLINQKYFKIFFPVLVGKSEEDVSLSDVCLHDTITRTLKDPNIILGCYDKLNSRRRLQLTKQVPSRRYVYSTNQEKNIETMMSDIVEEILTATGIEAQDFVKGLSIEQRKKFESAFISKINKAKGHFSNKIFDYYTNRLKEVSELLDETGELQDSVDIYNKRVERVGLSGLKVEYEKKKKTNKPKLSTVKDITDLNVIKKLSIDNLYLYNAYFINRASKTFTSILKSRFLKSQLAGRDIDTVSDEEIKIILGKYKFLQQIQRNEYAKKISQRKEKIKNIGSEESTEIKKDSNAVLFNISLGAIDLDVQGYKDYLDQILPGYANNLYPELEQAFNDAIIFENIYVRKDYAIKSLVLRLMTKENDVINWGYIPEEIDGKNTIERDKKMILLGVDLRRLNQPIRFHISRQELEEVVKGIKGNSKIPVYYGVEDWILDYEGKILSTQGVLPTNKHMKEEIKRYYTTVPKGVPRRKYIEHLMWMQDSTYKPKNYVAREVDLSTGIIEEVRDNRGIGE